jgi:hypothetical protein
VSFQAKPVTPKPAVECCNNELITLFVDDLLNAAGNIIVDAVVPDAQWSAVHDNFVPWLRFRQPFQKLFGF